MMLPSALLTAFRGQEVFEFQVEFSSRLMKEIFFEALMAKRNPWLPQQYFTLQDDPKYFESIAFNFLDGSSNYRYSWMPMQLETDQTLMETEDLEKVPCVSWVLDRSLSPILTERMAATRGSSSESPVSTPTPSRDTSPTRPVSNKRPATQQPDEASPLPAKRPKTRQSPSSFSEQPQSTSTAKIDLPPPFKRCYYYKATLNAIEEGMLYIPSTRVNPLFDTFILWKSVVFIFQAFSQDGATRQNMALRGIGPVEKIIDLCRKHTNAVEVVFVAIVPFGDDATLLVPKVAPFNQWRYFSLELDLPLGK
ncbi:hypothetical protein B0H13DRAFT_2078651 [Mycena leptocephala]|nr:hypothetical protein B0H13DRAFT_2078651 [Mycena leptocephala]